MRIHASGGIGTPDLSSQICTTNEFNVSVLMKLARLVGFDHTQIVQAVHKPVKNRTQRGPIVSAERCGDTNDRYAVLGGRDRQIRNCVFSTFDSTWTLDPRAELRELRLRLLPSAHRIRRL